MHKKRREVFEELAKYSTLFKELNFPKIVVKIAIGQKLTKKK